MSSSEKSKTWNDASRLRASKKANISRKRETRIRVEEIGIGIGITGRRLQEPTGKGRR